MSVIDILIFFSEAALLVLCFCGALIWAKPSLVRKTVDPEARSNYAGVILRAIVPGTAVIVICMIGGVVLASWVIQLATGRTYPNMFMSCCGVGSMMVVLLVVLRTNKVRVRLKEVDYWACPQCTYPALRREHGEIRCPECGFGYNPRVARGMWMKEIGGVLGSRSP